MKTSEIDYEKNYIRVESNYRGNSNEGPITAALQLCDNWDKISSKERYQFVDAAYDQYCCPEMNGYGKRNETLVICGELDTCSSRYIVSDGVIELALAQLDANGMLLHVWEANNYQTVEDYIEWSGFVDEEDDTEYMRLEVAGEHVIDAVTFEYCGDDAWDYMNQAEREVWLFDAARRERLDLRGCLTITDGLCGSISYKDACALTPKELRKEGYVTAKHWNLCGQTDEDYAQELDSAQDDLLLEELQQLVAEVLA